MRESRLTRMQYTDTHGGDRFELYNLKDDIGETRDLSAAEPELAERLDEEITQYLKRVEALVPVANPSYQASER